MIYTGQEATEQILYSLNWAQKEKTAKSYFLIGSDYIWPRTSMKIARKHVENSQKGKIVGEEYYPLGSTNFGSLMNKIKPAKYGKDAVIGDVTQAGYLGPWLWKAAVEKAGSFDVDKVVAASETGTIELKTAPEGYAKLDKNHRLWRKSRSAQGLPNGAFKVVSESPELIKPDPFPKGYQ